MRSNPARRQRGAIGLTAVFTMSLSLLLLLVVVDSGRLYLDQRKLQRIADLAALEAAEHLGTCDGSGASAYTLARTSATRNGLAANHPLVASCGYLLTGQNSLRTFIADTTRKDAIKVEIRQATPTSIAGGLFKLVQEDGVADDTTLQASAVAAKGNPVAMLSLRTTLATVTSSQGTLLNSLTKTLGGSTQLNLVGWQGIADTQINLLDYFDQLAVDLNLEVGNYQQVLQLDSSATVLLQAAVKVLQRSGAAVDVTTNLAKIAADLPIGGLQLGRLVNVQSGTAQAGLGTSVQLLQLVQGVIQLAAIQRAVNVDLPINVLGLANGRVYLRVIEPTQFSAIGDPSEDDLYVQSAQVRALVSLDLPLLDGIAGLANAVLDLAAPLTTVLNNLLSLNLMGTVGSLTCALGVPCKVSDIKLLDSQVHIDVGLEVAKAYSRLPKNHFSCAPKHLTTQTKRVGVTVAIGNFTSPASFLSGGPNEVKALPLIDIGTNICSRLLMLPAVCGTRTPFAGGGIGVRVDSKLLGGSAQEKTLVFADNFAPPNIGLPPVYQAMDSDQAQVVASLGETLAGVKLEAYKPTANSPLGQVLQLTAGLLDGVKGILEPLIKNLLSPLLDPLVNNLLKVLGIDLVNAQVGANLSCSGGHAQLVM